MLLIPKTNAKYYKCYKEVNSKATILCETCHKEEIEKVHRYDTPPAPRDYVPARFIFRRPTASSRRIVRKGPEMS